MKALHILVLTLFGTIFQAKGMVVMHRQLIGSEGYSDAPDVPDNSERLFTIIDRKLDC